MTEICSRIKEQLDKAGLNGKDLAKLLGLKKSPLTDWKNQKSKPTLEQILIICDFFAISSDYLLFGKSKSMTFQEQNLLDFFHKMSPCEQEDLIMIAEMKAGKGKRQGNVKSSLSEKDDLSSETA